MLGWLLAKGIAPTQASGNTQAWHLNPLKGVTETYEKTRQDIPLITAIFGAAFFLLIGGFVQMNLIPYGVTYMGFEQMEDAHSSLFVAAGIGAGAMGAGLLSGRHIEFGLVPLGAIGLALTLGLLGLQVGSDHFYATGAILALMGLSGGLFIVTGLLHSMAQPSRAPD